MIQYALLFGLGFLSAALLAILISPAIHRRIVRYTENRIRATLPISPEEVRAQRDMARAVYAAENARTSQELSQAREKNTRLMLDIEALNATIRTLEDDRQDLKMQADTLDVEAAATRSRLRQEDSYIQELKVALEQSHDDLRTRDVEIGERQQHVARLIADTDNFRIDLSSHTAEMEGLKARIGNLRDERETLRTEIRDMTTRAKEAEGKVKLEEQRRIALQERLDREIAEGADRAEALERRQQEIERLREKLKTANAEARDASRALRKTGLPAGSKPKSNSGKINTPGPEEIAAAHLLEEGALAVARPTGMDPEPTMMTAAMMTPAMIDLADDARNRATAVSERLLKSRDGANDAALRQELATIAASLVALTAAREGKASPINTILSGKSGNSDRESLAARAKKAMAKLNEQSSS
ncbi:hypothetical protein [Neorhizobium sp. DAR64872/K0K18]|uniref:hypothetical protein n=1 Tax=Neorhizobium sp. DAR64872/K0K18 TaxID=3421958 RepID=UPI003D2C3002